MSDEQLNAMTEKIIGCAFKVSNTLGCGFLEKVYENALVHELRPAPIGHKALLGPALILYLSVLICVHLWLTHFFLISHRWTSHSPMLVSRTISVLSGGQSAPILKRCETTRLPGLSVFCRIGLSNSSTSSPM